MDSSSVDTAQIRLVIHKIRVDDRVVGQVGVDLDTPHHHQLVSFREEDGAPEVTSGNPEEKWRREHLASLALDLLDLLREIALPNVFDSVLAESHGLTPQSALPDEPEEPPVGH